MTKLYGAYSQAAVDSGADTATWTTTDGREVEATYVDDDPECRHFRAPDRVLLGQVVECVRFARVGPGGESGEVTTKREKASAPGP